MAKLKTMMKCSLACLIPAVLSQTYTSCNPLERTSCPNDTALSSSTFSTNFTTSSSLASTWNCTSGSSLITFGSDGATFEIAKSGDAPTIETDFYFFFGSVSVVLQAASGTGIVSSIVLESDDLDEIDWEWIGGEAGEVQSNYFGKGNTTLYDRSQTHAVDAATTTSHNYTVAWSSTATNWYIDGALIRTLEYAQALGGKNYPQTPMRLKIGIWAGGDSSLNSEGTVTWAGGETDFDDGPFKMVLQSVELRNENPGSSYTWGDQTGDWQSIIVNGASSNASETASLASSQTAILSSSSLPTSSSAALQVAASGVASNHVLGSALLGLAMASCVLISVV